MSNRKKHSKDESQESAFDTQPAVGPDGQPVQPPLPDRNDPAFATQIVSTPDDSASKESCTPAPEDSQDVASGLDTQQVPGPDGKPVEKPDPNINNPAFATLIVPPGDDGELSDDDFGAAEDSSSDATAGKAVYSTQPMDGPDGERVESPDPHLNNPAFATQMLPTARDPYETDRDVIAAAGQRPSENDLKRLSQTIAADSGQMAELVKAARTQRHAITLPEAGSASGADPKEQPQQPIDRSTWNLRIKRRGVEGYVSGIVNDIPDDPSKQTGLQSALVSDDSVPEYEVIGQLGAGNMGIVYRARQTSLNRQLAIKSLKPTSKNSDHEQAMFVSEAVVTANLVHPNIVPIHDLGRTSDGKLFYTMKQVSGTPWNETIREHSLEENLDIFMKICDAVAYAHSKGVINRDLKPENVVVGNYGEVNVLDWGLAITSEKFEQKDSVIVDFRGGGGTPAYMAPELAQEDIRKIGPWSDIYLLGAILFEVLEGFPPHLLRSAWESEHPQNQLQSVIFAVLNNQIEEDVRNEGELMEIARKAMRTNPSERWNGVEEFKDAIREYRITGRAEELMQEVSDEGATTYSKYQTAVALYDDALRRWPDNDRALNGDRRARLAYAEMAHAKGDIDLGLQILPAGDDPAFAKIRSRLQRTQAVGKIVRTTWVALFLAAIGLSVWLITTNTKLLNAEQALVDIGVQIQDQTQKLAIAEQAAETAGVEAEQARVAALQAGQAAEASLREAELQTQRAETARAEVQTLAEEVTVVKQEVQTQMQLATSAREEAVQAREVAETEKAAADVARKQAEEQRQLAMVATDQAKEQRTIADSARKEATAQAELAQVAKREADDQKALADEQTQLAKVAQQEAKAAEREKVIALKEAERTRIEGRLEQVDAKMEIRKYDDVMRLVDEAMVEFESIASQPELIELLEKKKQEAQRLTGNMSVRLEGRTQRAAASPDGSTLVVSAYEETPTVTVFRDIGEQGISRDNGIVIHPVGRTVRDVDVSQDGRIVSVIGRSNTSRRFYHQLWVWNGERYQDTAYSETNTRRPPQCLISPDAQSVWLLTSGQTGLVTLYDVSSGEARKVLQQQLDEATNTFPLIYDAVLLPDESAIIVATREGCRSIRVARSEGSVQITTRKKGQAFNNVFPAPRGLNRLGLASVRDRFETRQLAVSADGSMLALINSTRVIVIPRDANAGPSDFPYTNPEELNGNGVVDTSYGTRIAVEFSPNGQHLVTAGRRYIQIWDRAGDRFELRKLEALYDGNSIAGHSRSVEHVTFIAGDTDRLVSVSGDSVVRTWTLGRYHEYVDGMQHLRDVFRSEAEKVLEKPVEQAAIDGHDHSLHGSAVLAMPATTGFPSASQRSQRKSRYLLASQQSEDRARRVRQARRVFSATFSQDAERVVIGANDLAAHAFETRTGSRTASMSMQFPRDAFFAPQRNNFMEGHIPEIVSVRFLPPRGDVLLTLDYFGSISVWDARNDQDGIGYEKSRPLPGQPVVSEGDRQPYEVEDPSCEITVSPAGRFVMAGGVRNDGHPDVRRSRDSCFVAVWRREDVLNDAAPQPWRVLEDVHENRVTAAAFSPSGDLAITGGRRGQLVLWDFQNEKVLAERRDTHNTDGISGVFFVSESEFISAGFDGRLYRWKYSDGELTESLMERGAGADDPDFIIRLRPSADGARFITSDLSRNRKGAAYNLHLNYWTTAEGWQKTLPAGVDAPPEDPGQTYRHDVSWSPNGGELMFVNDRRLIVMDTSSWEITRGFQLPAKVGAVRAAFSPNADESGRIATFDGRFAHLWDVRQGKHLAEFRSHGPFVRADYSADRKYLITGSESIRVFDADEDSPDHGRPVFRLSRHASGRSVFADVQFSPLPGDYRFATVSRLGAVQLWDWDPEVGPPGAALFTAPGPTDLRADYILPNAVCWSDDGEYLAAVQLGQLSVWKLQDGLPVSLNMKYPRQVAPVNLVTNDLDFSADGERLTAGGSYEDESYAIVWKLDDNNAIPVAAIDAQEYHSSWEDNADGLTGITCIGFDGERDEILTGGADSRVLRWQMRQSDPGEVVELPYIASMLGGPQDEFSDPHNAAVSDLDIARNGSILTADEAGYFVIWPASR